MPNIVSGCFCQYCALDFENFTCLCKEKGECLCLVSEACMDFNEPSLGCGCTTNEDNKECCKLACVCCSYGCKTPEKLCASASLYLCFRYARSCPFDDMYVKECVCASYGIQCAPECSCCGSKGTECPALERPLTDYSRVKAPGSQKVERP